MREQQSLWEIKYFGSVVMKIMATTKYHAIELAHTKMPTADRTKIKCKKFAYV